MPLSIESVLPIWAFVIVGHVIAFAIDTFKGVRTQFTLFGFKTRGVQFEVGFAAPGHVSMMFDLMRTAIFLTLGTMSFAQKSCMTPFPAVMALRHSWIHVSASNSGYKSTVVEGVINE